MSAYLLMIIQNSEVVGAEQVHVGRQLQRLEGIIGYGRGLSVTAAARGHQITIQGVDLVLGCDDEQVLLGEGLQGACNRQRLDAQRKPKHLLQEHCLQVRLEVVQVRLLLLVEVVILQSGVVRYFYTYARRTPRFFGGSSRCSKSRTWIVRG